MSMMLPGSCAQVFCLLSHHRGLNSVCVNCQADVQDQEEDKWQCSCFRGRLGVQVHPQVRIHLCLPVLSLDILEAKGK